MGRLIGWLILNVGFGACVKATENIFFNKNITATCNLNNTKTKLISGALSNSPDNHGSYTLFWNDSTILYDPIQSQVLDLFFYDVVNKTALNNEPCITSYTIKNIFWPDGGKELFGYLLSSGEIFHDGVDLTSENNKFVNILTPELFWEKWSKSFVFRNLKTLTIDRVGVSSHYAARHREEECQGNSLVDGPEEYSAIPTEFGLLTSLEGLHIRGTDFVREENFRFNEIRKDNSDIDDYTTKTACNGTFSIQAHTIPTEIGLLKTFKHLELHGLGSRALFHRDWELTELQAPFTWK